MESPLKPIEPKNARWEPTTDPNNIVVPGLDTTASVFDQIDQIEQLITIKLQNIDANFSQIQQVMSNRILPAVKRYAVGTEPVREAAKFWTTFFEQAAQIRVPTYEEEIESSIAESETGEELSHAESNSELEETPRKSRLLNPDGSVTSESSFMLGQDAIMSTPATARHRSQYSHDESHASAEPSWQASMESPLVRLDREIQSLTRDDEVSVASSSMLHVESQYDESQDVTQRQIPQTSIIPQSDKSKGKAKEVPQPLLRGILKRNVDASNVSPLKVKARTPVLKKLNPYLPPDTEPSQWKGVVDLKDPTVTTPGRKGTSSRPKGSAKRSVSRGRGTEDLDLDLDDSFDKTLGMSPPITMDFARLPKAKTPKLGKTPKKEAASRIMQNLIDNEKLSSARSTGPFAALSGMASVGASVESSLSNVPTPPSLSRYNRNGYPHPGELSNSIADASLESMMRRVGLSIHGLDASYGGGDTIRKGDSTISSATAPSLPSTNSYRSNDVLSSASASASKEDPDADLHLKYNLARIRDDSLDIGPTEADDSSDSLDYEEQPSVVMDPDAQQQMYGDDDDDSFDSDRSGDSFDAVSGGEHMDNPFAEGMAVHTNVDDGFDDDDDSFDDPDGEEETLFGVPPAQRLAAQAAAAQRAAEQQNFRMLGGQLLEDTIGIGAQMAQAGRVEETPTPWPGGR